MTEEQFLAALSQRDLIAIEPQTRGVFTLYRYRRGSDVKDLFITFSFPKQLTYKEQLEEIDLRL